MMSQLDRVLLAFEAMIDAKRQGRGEPGCTGPSGGVRGGRWRHLVEAMFEAARAIQGARPANLPPHECEVPISF